MMFTREVVQRDRYKLLLTQLIPYTFEFLPPGFLHRKQHANQYVQQTVEKILALLGETRHI